MRELLRPRGAAACVLHLLGQLAGSAGQIEISLIDLAAESGYSVPTVQCAVRQLESARYLERAQPCAQRPTRYTLICPTTRRAILAGELLGVVAPVGGAL